MFEDGEEGEKGSSRLRKCASGGSLRIRVKFNQGACNWSRKGNRETRGESNRHFSTYHQSPFVGKETSLRSRSDLPFAVAQNGEEGRASDRSSVSRRPKPLPGRYDSTERHPRRSDGDSDSADDLQRHSRSLLLRLLWRLRCHHCQVISDPPCRVDS